MYVNGTISSGSLFLRSWLLWVVGFLAFPIAGLAGSFIVGHVDNPLSALIGGAIAGLVIGAGQTLASNQRLQATRWIPATTLGMSAGLFLGATLVSYGTSLADLALMGAVNGFVLGACQAPALPRGTASRWIWVPVVSALWALGWTISTLLQIRVDEQFIVFGASGAVVFAALSGLVLHRLVPSQRRPETPTVLPVKRATA